MSQTNVFKASLCACCKFHFPLGHHKKVNKYVGIFQNFFMQNISQAKIPTYMIEQSTTMKTSTPTEEEVSNHALASRLIDEVWTWGGTKPFVFKTGGELKTPWGAGKWSLVRDGASTSPNAIWADFVGAHHLLKFETPEGSADEDTMFVAERCADGNLVIGRRVVEA